MIVLSIATSCLKLDSSEGGKCIIFRDYEKVHPVLLVLLISVESLGGEPTEFSVLLGEGVNRCAFSYAQAHGYM